MGLSRTNLNFRLNLTQLKPQPKPPVNEEPTPEPQPNPPTNNLPTPPDKDFISGHIQDTFNYQYNGKNFSA